MQINGLSGIHNVFREYTHVYVVRIRVVTCKVAASLQTNP